MPLRLGNVDSNMGTYSGDVTSEKLTFTPQMAAQYIVMMMMKNTETVPIYDKKCQKNKTDDKNVCILKFKIFGQTLEVSFEYLPMTLNFVKNVTDLIEMMGKRKSRKNGTVLLFQIVSNIGGKGSPISPG